MNEEVLEVLKMVKEGTVTPEQGAQLIEALRAPTAPGSASQDEAEGPEFSNLGEMTLTREFLLRLHDGTEYHNLGRTAISADVTEDLLARKIGKYINLGQTIGPARLLAVLVSRLCEDNLGQFIEAPEPAHGEAAGA